MPDMNNFALEKKRGFKGKGSGPVGGVGNRERASAKGRKRPSDATDRSDDEATEWKKKQRISLCRSISQTYLIV